MIFFLYTPFLHILKIHYNLKSLLLSNLNALSQPCFTYPSVLMKYYSLHHIMLTPIASGLDAHNARTVVEGLYYLANTKGHTIAAVLHQPR